MIVLTGADRGIFERGRGRSLPSLPFPLYLCSSLP